MWGTSFADLAKKAHELQEAASAIAVTSPAGLFNLDAMQSGKPPDEKHDPTKPAPRPEPQVVRPVQHPHMMDQLFTTPMAAPKAPPKGKLQIPVVAPTTAPLMTPTVATSVLSDAWFGATPSQDQLPPEADTTTTTKGDANDDNTADGLVSEEDGWADVTDDLDAADLEDEEVGEKGDKPEEQHRETGDLATAKEDAPPAVQEDDQPATDDGVDRAIEIPPLPSDGQAIDESEVVVAEKDSQHQSTEEPSPQKEHGQVTHGHEPASMEEESTEDPVPQQQQQDKDQANGREETTIADTPTQLPEVTHKNEKEPDSAVASKTEPRAQPAAPVIPDDMLRQFSEQMKRLEENHQAEQLEMEQKHARELKDVQKRISQNAKEVEERLLAQVRKKDEQIYELRRANEGYGLKMDGLKRELAGTQALLEERKSDMGKASEESFKTLRALEKMAREAEGRVLKEQENTKRVEATLEATRGELEASRKEHADLKERAKAIAAELKDRRSECRDLDTQLENMTELKRDLESQIENLEFQLSNQDKTTTEATEEMEQLRSQLVESNSEVEKRQKLLDEQSSKHEKALMEYKKKAQSSLALANSRTAAAVQAKEEAELEARAARSTADTAMERAVKAEISSREALAEAKAYVREMEIEKEQALKDCSNATSALNVANAKLELLKESLAKSTASEQRRSTELGTAVAELLTVKAKVSSLEEDLAGSTSVVVGLRSEVASLREKLRRAEEAAAQNTSEEKERQRTAAQLAAEADHESVAILQQELQEANQTILDLKEAMKNAVDLSDKARPDGSSGAQGAFNDPEHSSTNSNGSTPLFYAMEKQAELNTARTEINRLANILSDVQSEKMEAMELMGTMKTRMEDAEARLMRYERLRSTGASAVAADGNDGSAGSGPPVDSGAVNIEYLKNIMLSYLNAKTIAEKKSLVPVIGAVLCLTRDEQRAAMKNLEESGSIGFVGSSLFQSMLTK